MWGIRSWFFRWASGAFDKLVPLCTILHPFVFPHIFPILLALTKREVAHFLKFARRQGLREVREGGLYCGSLAGEFHLHHLKGKEGIPCILLSFLKLLEDVRALSDCRVVDPIGIDA